MSSQAYLFCRVRDNLAGLGFSEVTEHHEGSLAIGIVSKESDGARHRMRGGVEVLHESKASRVEPFSTVDKFDYNLDSASERLLITSLGCKI